MAIHLRPVVVVSKCLTFDACRWNGVTIASELVDMLKPHVDFRPVCAEVEIGLGVPRDPVRVVSAGGELRLLQSVTERDMTQPMREFTDRFLAQLDTVDGFILKSRSPSCGIKDVKIYPSLGKVGTIGSGAGFFGGAIVERFAGYPIEDEGRLTNFTLRDHFLTQLFILRRFREVKASSSAKALIQFHAENKFLLMAHHQERMRAMGRLVALHGQRPLAEILTEYETHLRNALSRLPRRSSYANVWMHAFGYVSGGLSAKERAFFLELLEQYRAGQVPLNTLIHVMRAWIIRFDQNYLAQQTLFEPYPPQLIELLDSGQGRKLKG